MHLVYTLFPLAFFFAGLSGELLFVPNSETPVTNFLLEKCPPSMNGPLLEQIGEIRIHGATAEIGPFGCAKILECTFMSSPTETMISWYKNGKLIGTNAVRELGLAQPTNIVHQQASSSSLGEMTHRICVDSFLRGEEGKPVEFRCRAQLGCDPSVSAESNPLIMKQSQSDSKSGTKERRSLSLMTPQLRYAPLIEQVTSSRIEMAGNLAQMICKASGNPKPKIEWFVMSEELDTAYPVEKFPFIMKLSNEDLLVDTADTSRASLNFKCQATNRLGRDTALGTLIILSES